MRILFISSLPHPQINILKESLEKNAKLKVDILNTSITSAYQYLTMIYNSLLSTIFCLLKDRSSMSYIFKNFIRSLKSIHLTKRSLFNILYIYLRIISYIFVVYKKIINRNYSIIHAFWLYPAGMVGLSISRITGIPLVVSVLGYDVDNRTLVDGGLVNIAKHVINNCDILVLGDVEYKSRRILRMGIDLGKIYIAKPLISFEMFNKNKCKHHRKERKNIVVGFGPHMEQIYGVKDFLKVVDSINRERNDVIFLMVGKGRLSKYVRRYLANRNINNVIFLGAIPYEFMPKVYCHMDIYCMLCYNAHGLSVLEAMAMGIPVIGYKVKISRIIDRYTGFTVPKKRVDMLVNKILELADDRVLMEKLGSNATTYVRRNFETRNIINSYVELYVNVLRGVSRRGKE